MGSLVFNTTAAQDQVLNALAPDGDGPAFLRARIVAIVGQQVADYRAARAKLGVEAFLKATAAQQEAAITALGA